MHSMCRILEWTGMRCPADGHRVLEGVWPQEPDQGTAPGSSGTIARAPVFNVRQFGASGDGASSTRRRSSGDRHLCRRRRWLGVGARRQVLDRHAPLKSNVKLHVATNATILGSTDLATTPPASSGAGSSMRPTSTSA